MNIWLNILLFIFSLPFMLVSMIIGWLYQSCVYGFTRGQYDIDKMMQRDWIKEYLKKDNK